MVWSQISYRQEEAKGVLYLVPTPIGNLEDITFRALATLKKVDYIACEDTRQTRKLLNHFQIEKRLLSYHEHNQRQKGPLIVRDLRAGKKIAYVTDAGMPAISDPGEQLAQQALEEQISVIALPGANAALTALVGSGLSSTPYLFYGFLDRHKKKKRRMLKALRYIPYTLLFHEAPHRLQETLKEMLDVFGDREGALVRELSKTYEEYIRGKLSELVDWCTREEVKGEICLVVSGYDDAQMYGLIKEKELAPPWWKTLTLQEHVDHYVHKGFAVKEAIKQTANDRKLPKREVYQAYHLE